MKRPGTKFVVTGMKPALMAATPPRKVRDVPERGDDDETDEVEVDDDDDDDDEDEVGESRDVVRANQGAGRDRPSMRPPVSSNVKLPPPPPPPPGVRIGKASANAPRPAVRLRPK
jgi:hypothetical protein